MRASGKYVEPMVYRSSHGITRSRRKLVKNRVKTISSSGKAQATGLVLSFTAPRSRTSEPPAVFWIVTVVSGVFPLSAVTMLAASR